MYTGTKKLNIKGRKIAILGLKYTFEKQNRLSLVLKVLVYLVFRVNGGSLDLLYSLFGQCYLFAKHSPQNLTAIILASYHANKTLNLSR